MDTYPSHDSTTRWNNHMLSLSLSSLQNLSLSLSSSTLLCCWSLSSSWWFVLPVRESRRTLASESQCVTSWWRFRRRNVRPRSRDLRLQLLLQPITWLSAFSEAASSSRSSTATYALRPPSMSSLARLVLCSSFTCSNLMNSSFVKCFDVLD